MAKKRAKKKVKKKVHSKAKAHSKPKTKRVPLPVRAKPQKRHLLDDRLKPLDSRRLVSDSKRLDWLLIILIVLVLVLVPKYYKYNSDELTVMTNRMTQLHTSYTQEGYCMGVLRPVITSDLGFDCIGFKVAKTESLT